MIAEIEIKILSLLITEERYIALQKKMIRKPLKKSSKRPKVTRSRKLSKNTEMETPLELNCLKSSLATGTNKK